MALLPEDGFFVLATYITSHKEIEQLMLLSNAQLAEARDRAERLAKQLEFFGLGVQALFSADAFRASLAECPPSAIVMDVDFTGAGLRGQVEVLLREGIKLAPIMARTRLLRAYAGVRPLVAVDGDETGRNISPLAISMNRSSLCCRRSARTLASESRPTVASARMAASFSILSSR